MSVFITLKNSAIFSIAPPLKYAPLRSDFITADGTVSTLNDKTAEPKIKFASDDEIIIDGETGEIVTDASEAQG